MSDSDRIVLTMSLNPALDPELVGTAYKTLALLRSLAGHARKLTTLTCSLAAQLGRSVRTVQRHLNLLEAAGYIWRRTCHWTGEVFILIRESVEPPSRRAQLEAERQEAAAPKPRTWGLLPRPLLAWREPANRGGATPMSDIKTSKEERRLGKGWNGVAQAPIRTVAEQLAILLGA